MNKILLIGDSCTDIFVYGDCYRLNPEAPTPVLSETYRKQYSGMGANVLKNIEVLGLKADFLTQIEPIIKTRYVDYISNYVLLRIDNDKEVSRIRNIKKIDFSVYDMIIISDYNKGFLLKEDLIHILKQEKLIFIDTKKSIGKWIENASFIKINQIEYNNINNNLNFLKDFKEHIITTLGGDGVRYNDILFKPQKEVTVRDVVGAGDTFLASVSCHYYFHKDIIEAIKFANLCAGEVVSQRGTAFPNQKLI